MSIEIIAIKPEVKTLETLDVATAVWSAISDDIRISFSAGRAFKQGDSTEIDGIGAAIARGLGIYNQPNVMRFYPRTDLEKICIETILSRLGWESISNQESILQ